jgi:8-oxo-dGTP pyrophosphatase MutT (NUDIX family)
VNIGSPPSWLETVAAAARNGGGLGPLSRHVVPEGVEGRHSAVLMLFGETEADGTPVTDVLLTERAHTMRSHPGQPAFPGGTLDPADDGPIDAALREAAEETGLDPSGVEVMATFPELWLPPGGYIVTPVLGWWRRPSAVSVMDAGEVASVRRVPIDDLVEPANRVRVRHPSGYVGPAFEVSGLLVWGFTAGILSAVLDAAGLTRPWDHTRVVPLPPINGAGSP